MPVTFAKAPLQEIIVEVRWPSTAGRVQANAAPGVAAPLLVIGGPKTEEFFARLGDSLYQLGFQQSERIVPLGFPTLPNQPIIRYRSVSEPQKAVLYQVGADIFSVNGIPPYRSWDDFSPSVRKGIEALLKSRTEAEARAPFTQITLRYLDFFGDELLRGRSIEAFVSEVLGISVTVPQSVYDVAADRSLKNLAIRFVLPVNIGNLTLSVADGKSKNRDGIVMDMFVTSVSETPPDIGNIMGILDNAHAITHHIFMGLTKPIQAAMEPEGKDH